LTDSYDSRAKIGALEALYVTGSKDRDKNQELIETLRDRTKDMSAYGALEFLLHNRELMLIKDKSLDSYEVEDLQKKLIQMTEYVLTKAHDSREDVLASMRSYAEKELEREVILEENVNAVRFMNLHKAKGLEGKIVIWTNRREDMSFKKGSYRLKKDFYPEIEAEYNGQKTNIWSAHNANRVLQAQALREYEEEKIRLEYVAATRAEEVLIFMDNYSKKSMFTEDFDLDNLPEIPQFAAGSANSTAGTSVTKVNEKRIEQKAQLDNSYRDTFGKVVFSSESPSDYENGSAGRGGKKETVSGEDAEDDTQAGIEVNQTEEIQSAAEHNNDQSTALSNRPSGNIFGTVMHRSLELFVNRHKIAENMPNVDLAELCIKQALEENADDIPEPQTAQYHDFLKDVVNAYKKWFNLPDSIVSKADEMHTELPFSYMLKGEKGQDVWMHGEADLVLKLKDGRYYVIDYKSDDDKNHDNEDEFVEILKKRYCPQIAAYKRAISALYGVAENTIGAALISFSERNVPEGERIRVRVTEIEGDN
jgi:ATP-dependent exoDNAse (exonuclease V) beta subunit